MTIDVPGATVSERLADYACGLTYDDVPTDVIDTLKTVIVHDLVVGIVGSQTPEAEQALDYIRSDIGSAGRSTVIGHSVKASPIDAAFANAVIIRAVRQEDTTMSTFIHAGALLIPTALAMGEHLGSSGADVITALIAGYEVAGTLARPAATPGTRAVRTPSHVYGGFGVAVTAAKLMGLDREQTATAISYAGNIAAMVTAGFQNHQYGVVVRNGLSAAYFGQSRAPAERNALEGVPGFFDAQLGAIPSGLDEHIASLGATFDVMTSRLKSFPCSGLNAVAAILLQRMMGEHALRPGDVAGITVHRSGSRNAVVVSHHDSIGPWAGPAEAVSSVPFALAAVLLDGEVTPWRLEQHDDPAIAEYARLVETRRDDSMAQLAMRVEVETSDGHTFSAEGDDQLLAVPDPVDITRLHGSTIINAEDVDRLMSVVARLEHLDNLEPLTSRLVKIGARSA